MDAVEQIRNAIESGQTANLTAIGSLQDLATVSVELADELAGIDLFLALDDQAREVPGLWPIALSLLDAITEAGIMTEISSQIVGGLQIYDPVTLHQTLIAKCRNKALHYAVRAQALRSGIYLAQDSRARRGEWKGLILSADPADDGNFLKYIAASAGVLLAHTHDSDLRDLLHDLLKVPDAEDEAAQQLGMSHLNDALAAQAPAAVVGALREAKAWFSRSSEQGEERPDANLYGACVSLLLDFHERKGASTRDLKPHLDAIIASITSILCEQAFQNIGHPTRVVWQWNIEG